jgi:hypothetical protein
MIRAYHPIDIKYEKDSGEVSTRTIIPTTNVPHNVKAVDISSLSEDEQLHMIALFEAYDEYTSNHMKKMFDFQNWVEHTTGEGVGSNNSGSPLSWRTFKLSNTTIL